MHQRDQSLFADPLLRRSLVVLLLSGLTIAACLLTKTPTSTSTPGVLMQLPAHIQSYYGKDQEVSLAEKTILPPDTEFARKQYRSLEGDEIYCSIVLSGAEKRSIHRPEICLVGQGWTVQSGQTLSVPLDHAPPLRVMALRLTRPYAVNAEKTIQLHSHYLYWFVGHNVTTPHHWQRIWLTSWDRLAHQMNHRWAYVTVTALVTEGLKSYGKNSTETMEALMQFIKVITPSFMLPSV